MQMTERAIEIRKELLEDAVERYGREKVEEWAENPAKRRIVNALCQMEADEEG